MADTFVYRVKDQSGKVLEGSLEADSVTLVATRLRSMGYVPIAIDKKNNGGVKRELKIPGFSNRVKLKDVAVFSRQFATMINSGLTLLRSLTILAEQTENKALAEVVDQVRQDVERGSSLSHALARHPNVFNRLYVAMVRAGETGGVLDSVLVQLAGTIEKQVELRGKIKSAMTYPVAVLALVIMILTAMLVFIVPMFKKMYDSLGGTLPVPTRVLLLVSSTFVKFFPLVVIAQIGAIIGFKKWIQSDDGRAKWDTIKLRIPVFGKLVHKTALTRFSRTFAVLLRSGVPILESLEITSETVGNVVVQRAVKDVQKGVKTGESIAKPLEAHKVFPPMWCRLRGSVREPERSTNLLARVARFTEKKSRRWVPRLTHLLNPRLS